MPGMGPAGNGIQYTSISREVGEPLPAAIVSS